MTHHLNTGLITAWRTAGLNVVEMPGWQDRGRDPEHGDFAPQGDLFHHTGASDKVPGSVKDDYDYAVWLFTVGRSDLPAPLAQVSIGRDGTLYVGAAGRANHAGKARKAGPVPAGDGNVLYIGFECQNSGTEGWPKAQYEAMVTAAAVADRWGGWGSASDRGHKETSLTGKWDPGGLDMDRFRLDISMKKVGRKLPNMGPVQKARIGIVAAVGELEQSIEYLRDEAGPGRPVAFAQRVPLRAAINMCKAVLRVLPATRKA